MNENEYNEKLKKIESDYEKLKRTLYHDFAMSNNNVKVGDYVTDRLVTIKVESIRYCVMRFGDDFPQCVYSGPMITKAGKPFKNGSHDKVYQHNIKKIRQ